MIQLKNKKVKVALIGSLAFASAALFSLSLSPTASAESFGTDVKTSSKYAFSPQFTKASNFSTWGNYNGDWGRSNRTEIGNIGDVLPDADYYGGGGYARTLTSNGTHTDAGNKSYNGNTGVLYTNVGVNPKTNKAIDLRISIIDATPDYAFRFDYRKISFSESSIGFASTGYSNVRLQYDLLDHGTNNPADIQGVTLNMGDVNLGQTVTVNRNDYGKLKAAGVSKNSIINRRDRDGGVQYWTKIDSGDSQSNSLSLAFDGSKMEVDFGKDYGYLYNYAQITIDGVTKTYSEWMRYYGNIYGTYRMRRDSAAAEFMSVYGAAHSTTILDSQFDKRIGGNQADSKVYTSNSNNPYSDIIKYQLKTPLNGTVPQSIGSGGKLKLTDSVDWGIRYATRPQIVAHYPDGSTRNVNNDFDYVEQYDETKFTLTSKDENYYRNNPGVYYTITYTGQLKDNKNAPLAKPDQNGYIGVQNNASVSWNGVSDWDNAKYQFKPTMGSASKSVSVDGQNADKEHPNVSVDTTKTNKATYTLSAHIGTMSSNNATMNKFNITDDLPNIFNKINTSDVTVWNNGKDVTGDMDVALSGDALNTQSLTVTPKNARDYYGADLQIKVTGTKNALTETTMGGSDLSKALDSNMTQQNQNDLASNGQTNVVVPNTFNLNQPGSDVVKSNEVNLNFSKMRNYVDPVMAQTMQKIRKSNNDADVYDGKSVDGYEGTVLKGSTISFDNMKGWTSVTGSNVYTNDIKFDTANKHHYLDYKKNQLEVQGQKVVLQTSPSANASETSVKLTRSGMWDDYKLSQDADLKNASLIITLKDDKGNVLVSSKHGLLDTADSMQESSSKTDTGVTSTDVFTIKKALATAKANYINSKQNDSTAKDAVKNIQVSASVELDGSNNATQHPAGDISKSDKFSDLTNDNVMTILRGRDSSAWTDYMFNLPLGYEGGVFGDKISEHYQGELVRVLSRYEFRTTDHKDGTIWMRVMTRDGNIFWVDQNATKDANTDKFEPSNAVRNFGSRDVNGHMLDITWENMHIDDVKNGADQKAWTPTGQTISYDDLASIQKQSDKQGTSKIGGLYTLKGIQATVSDLTKGSTTNKMETLQVADDALDFDISAGYGFSNNIKLRYNGYDLGNGNNVLGVNSLTTPKDQSYDMNGNGNDVTKQVKITSDNGKTLMENVYNLNQKQGSGSKDDDLGVAQTSLEQHFSLKNSYLDKNSNKVYYDTASGRANGGNKVYTSQGTTLDNPGQYHTNSVALTQKSGANQFKVAYDKHVAVDVPMILTSKDKSHNSDAELAFQPVFDGYKPSGFTAKQNDWLKK